MKKKYFIRGLGTGIVFSTAVLGVAYSTLSDDAIIKRAEKLGMVMKEDQTYDTIKNLEVTTTKPAVDNDAQQSDLPTKQSNDDLANSKEPAVEPTKKPTDNETDRPTNDATDKPTAASTKEPTKKPTTTPTKEATKEATKTPTATPTKEATKKPTVNPTKEATKTPTATPTKEVTKKPTEKPTQKPTAKPTMEATKKPTDKPTQTVAPTKEPEKSVTIHVKAGMISADVAKLLEEAGVISDAYSFDLYLIRNGYDSRLYKGSFVINYGDSYETIAKKIIK